jgi:hypothetical protein
MKSLRSTKQPNLKKTFRKKDDRSKILKEGWRVLTLRGNHFEIGVQHGRLLRKEIERVVPVMEFLVKEYYKTTLDEYVGRCRAIVFDQDEWRDIFDEMRGIAEGSGQPLDIVVAWNMFLSMHEIYDADSDTQRCSAFIATGSKTHDGKIIMAHNTHCDYSAGFISNIVLYVYPKDRIPFVMQTVAGLVSSSTDWFITEAGIVGCETTIANIKYKPDFKSGVPYFFRIRRAMETGRSLDDYVSIMLSQNAGDYACSWLFGDTESGEILRLELGKNSYGVERTHDGVFYGMNSVFTPEIVENEITDNSDIRDTKTSSGCRNKRLEFLLGEGPIDLKKARKILADHYDCDTDTVRKGIRGICKHKECEKGKDFKISGATDGKIVDAALAKQMKFIGRMGSSCGRVFRKSDYPDGAWKKVTPNMPKYDWITIRRQTS